MSDLERNKQVVVDYYTTAFAGNPEKAIADHFGSRYVQHNPEAKDGPDLRRRISSLPGFGEMKIKSLGAVLAKQFGVKAAEELAPAHPTLGDVGSPEDLERYQAWKREYKKAARSS